MRRGLNSRHNCPGGPWPGYRPALGGLRRRHGAAAGGRRHLGGRDRAGWETPRGPLGGYVMAIVLRAWSWPSMTPSAGALGDDALPALPAGGAGDRPRGGRARGRSLSTVSGRLEQDGKLIGLALGAYSKPWPGPISTSPDAGSRARRRPRHRAEPRCDATPPVHRAAERCSGGSATPRSAARAGEVGGWLGLLERRPVDALAVAICADAWFPAPWPRLAELAPGADDRADDLLPLPPPARRLAAARALSHPARSRRLLRRGRRALGARRHPGRPVAPARPAARAAEAPSPQLSRLTITCLTTV